jgi:hypothetical protein
MVTYDDWGNEKPAGCNGTRLFRFVFWTVLLLGAIGGAGYGIYRATHKSHHGGGGSGNYGPVTITTNNYTFSNALQLSLEFLNAQKCKPHFIVGSLHLITPPSCHATIDLRKAFLPECKALAALTNTFGESSHVSCVVSSLALFLSSVISVTALMWSGNSESSSFSLLPS